MVGTSKILTVSYGTFSCTLEGFDDSFNTMKAIAEYFRGLASDDRYFGAEPPTPDAEMLARIAEREISRRVDATIDDNGIVLRAAALADPSDKPSDAAGGDEQVHDDTSRAQVDAARKAAKTARKAEKADAKAKAKAKAKALKAAEKAAKAVKADAEAKAKAAQDAKDLEDARDEDGDASESSRLEQNSHLESASPATAEPAEGTAESAVEETHDDVPSSMLAAKDSVPDYIVAAQPIPAHPDADSVAAKLQRIRAVVGDADTDENAPSDDLTEQALPQMQTPDVVDAETGEAQDSVADLDTDEAETEEDTIDNVDQTPSDGDDMISRVMTGQATAEAEETPTQAEAEQPRARVVHMKRADFEKAMADSDTTNEKADVGTDVEDAADVAKPVGPDFGLLDGADDLDDYLEDSDFTEIDMSSLDDMDLAQDLKAIRDDASITVETSEIEAPDAADDTVDAVSEAIATKDEPAELDAETEVELVAEDAADTSNEAEDIKIEGGLTSEESDVDDTALNRLMDETDMKMQEPEGSRRRDAIAQLKAAVAAKEAARKVGEADEDDQDVENAFRNDLSEATRPVGDATVRPRPVVRSINRTERPRPAPLKLVAAQRVDMFDAQPRRDGPVVPRRVAAIPKDTTQPSASGSFAEFADNAGATDLPDLLEAAAAYTSFVEGADEFSRPQILRRVRSVASDDFNREDELRSFADLINAGRFTKVRNGRFQVADDSRFNPERRAG